MTKEKECSGTCGEHGDLMEYVGSMKGQVALMLKLMVILVAGMAYAITQNHRVDIQLVRMDTQLTITQNVLEVSRTDHNLRLTSLENSVHSLTLVCCDEAKEVK